MSIEYTQEQLDLLETKKDEAVQFEVITTLTLSIRQIEIEIQREKENIELLEKQKQESIAKKDTLEQKLDEVRIKILET